MDGGSNNQEFDIGEKVLLPYLLEKGITKIDYLIFSHFDADHCMGLFPIIQHITVKKILITKQVKITEEYKKIVGEAMKRKIPIQVVEKGDCIQVDKDTVLDILFPDKEFISQNPLNNNSMVIKLTTNGTSILFTGDIEEIAERKMIETINRKKLKADILKVAHHGSKSSSIQEFLEMVQPKIAIIGVGKKNKFGHPNEGVLERLRSLRYEDISNR